MSPTISQYILVGPDSFFIIQAKLPNREYKITTLLYETYFMKNQTFSPVLILYEKPHSWYVYYVIPLYHTCTLDNFEDILDLYFLDQ